MLVAMGTAQIVEWLTRNAPVEDLGDRVDGLARILLAEGGPLWQLITNSLVPYPELSGFGAMWQRGTLTTLRELSRAFIAGNLGSPFGDLNAGKFDELRERLNERTSSYPVLHTLADRGVTDYLLHPHS